MEVKVPLYDHTQVKAMENPSVKTSSHKLFFNIEFNYYSKIRVTLQST